MLRTCGGRGCMMTFVLLVMVAVSRPVAGQSIPDTLFDAPTRIELERIIGSARQAGLPAPPLINRALQGAARSVDGQRVVGVVRAYADSMRVALTLLGAGSGDSEIDAGAAALRAGVAREGVRQVRRTRSPGQATTALIVLTDLVRRGVPAPDATVAVTTVAASQPDNALLSLQSALARETSAPTAAQLRDAVQRQLRQRPPPDRLPDEGLVRALDGRTSPAAGHAAYVALSVLNPQPTSTGVWTALEGGFSTPLSGALSVSAGARAGRDIADSLVMQMRGGLSFTRRAGARGAIATWAGAESRPMPFAATAQSDSQAEPRDLGDRIGLRYDRGFAFMGGASAARVVNRRVTLGGLVELQSDRIVTRSLIPHYAQPGGPRPDTLKPDRYDEQVESAQRLFVHSALNAVIGPVALHGTLVHRLSGPRASGEPSTVRTLLLLSAEHHVTGGMNLFASISSREPSHVLGAVLPTDARFRLGARFVKRRALEQLTPAPERDLPISVAVARAAGDSTRSVVELTLLARGAREVLVEGDFTDWQPRALTRAGEGRFGGTFIVQASLIRFRVRIDGGRWHVPPGLAVDIDEYGDEVGVALVR